MRTKVSIRKNNLCVDIKKIKSFILDKWQSGYLYNLHYNKGLRGEMLYIYILAEIQVFFEKIEEDIEKDIAKKLNIPSVSLDWFDKYPKSDVRSIGFEILHFPGGPVEDFLVEDIPTILEFLDTPPDKALEAWDKWEHYWNNLDYEARHKKLLENAK